MTGMTRNVPVLIPMLTGFPGDIRFVHEAMADSTKFRVVHGIVENSIPSNANNDNPDKRQANRHEYCRKWLFFEKGQVSYNENSDEVYDKINKDYEKANPRFYKRPSLLFRLFCFHWLYPHLGYDISIAFASMPFSLEGYSY
jgi:hypothetical protein